MRDSVRLHRRAWQELRAAMIWYEARQPGLGGRFWDNLNEVFDRIADGRLPGMTAELSLPERKLEKAFLPHFPYTIYYERDGELCRVWAIAHQNRRPGYWVVRVANPK